ncbi:Uncharacterised protein [Bacillus freudenreichii]|nr:Uncharacterised protein [Bacillus freudenreichii]
MLSKKVISTVAASSLIFCLGSAVSAAPKNDGKPTGRTEQNVQTGVVSFEDLTVPRYAEEIQLTGTVVIDGPQLVVAIPGSTNTVVTKIGDKTWRYEATVDVSAMQGDAVLEISAYTIYANGKPAGSVHTSTPVATQKIHVPYITSTVAENTEWVAYDRSSNQFTLSYDEVENWSVGDPVVTGKTLAVNGTDDKVNVLDKELTVPAAILDFTFSSDDPTWDFDSNTDTYTATFNILITDSKGVVSTESVIKSGLTPGEEATVTHTLSDAFGTITKTHQVTAPKAPVVDVVAVELRDLELELVSQNQNQFKVRASYTIVYSDGSTKSVSSKDLKGNLGNPNTHPQNSSQDFAIDGFVYTVTAHYNPATKTYYATYVPKN